MNRILGLRKYLSLRPFDTTTEDGRSDERHRRIALTIALTALAKLISLLTPLVTIPLTLAYLGKTQYGLWMTLSSITVSLGFADFGVSLGLLNAVAECNGKDDLQGSRVYVSSGFFLLTGLATILGLLFVCLRRFIPWGSMFNGISESDARAIPHLVDILVLCLLLNMPLGIVDRIYLGQQEGYISSIFQMIGSVLALAGVVAAVKLNLGISGLIVALSGFPLLILLASGFNLIANRHPWARPRVSLIRWAAIERLLRLGSMFFVLQFCYTLSYNSDNIVIASTIGFKAVAEYVAPSRMFGAVTSILPMLLNPVWPAYVEAANRGDMAWVKRTLIRSIRLVLSIAVPANVILLLFGGFIVSYWTRGQINPSQMLLIALTIWGIVGAVASTTAIFMNAMNVVFYQSVGSLLMTFLNLGLSIELTRKIGLSGVVWGSITAQFLMLLPTCLIVIPRTLAKLKGKVPLQDQVFAL